MSLLYIEQSVLIVQIFKLCLQIKILDSIVEFFFDCLDFLKVATIKSRISKSYFLCFNIKSTLKQLPSVCYVQLISNFDSN